MVKGLVLVYITAANAEEAHRIGVTLVEERLAACANAGAPIDSAYWWQGALTRDREAAVIVKTREALLERLIARVKELHSYACPCVVALPIVGGNPDFLAWIEDETKPRGD